MAIQTLSMTIKTVSVPKAHTTATQEEGEDHALSQKAKKEDKEHKGKKLLATIMLAAREQSATEEHKANAAAPKEEGREDHAPCGLRAHHQLQEDKEPSDKLSKNLAPRTPTAPSAAPSERIRP